MSRLGDPFFSDPPTIGLCIYARAASKEHWRCCKSLEKVARAIEINATIKIDVSSARARAVTNHAEISFAGADLFRVRYVDRVDRIWLTCSSIGFCPAFYFPASTVKQIRSRLPHIAASGDQDSRHDRRCSRPRRRNFNFIKNVPLDRADLFKANQFEKREKSHSHFDTRNDAPKQI